MLRRWFLYNVVARPPSRVMLLEAEAMLPVEEEEGMPEVSMEVGK